MSGITVYSDKCHLCGMYFTYTLKKGCNPLSALNHNSGISGKDFRGMLVFLFQNLRIWETFDTKVPIDK